MLNYYQSTSHTFTAYWWMTGAGLNSMTDTYAATGNTTHLDMLISALVANKGDNNDYAPNSEKFDLGNDDQGIWGLSAMSAAEVNMTTGDSSASFTELAQAVFNEIMSRWDTSSCGGGVRWQIYSFNNGYSYKNSISNGILFQLAARLARYTNNDTYVDLAQKVWDWSTTVGFVDLDDYTVYDGASVTSNCSSITNEQWSYNVGVYLAGTAFLYNYTNGSSVWQTHMEGLMNKALDYYFTSDKIIYEPSCEPTESCNSDQTAFKGMLARFLGYTMQLAPYTVETIMPYIQSSAEAAALACSGGSDGVTCGYMWYWNNGTWDDHYGLGEQISAVETFQALLAQQSATILTLDTGASSESNPDAGTDDGDTVTITPATKSDKGWAGFLTFAFSFVFLLFSIWLYF